MLEPHITWVYYALAGLLMGGAVWWVVAPLMVRMGDPRLPLRNELHYRKVVMFYRLWGAVAALIGIMTALALR